MSKISELHALREHQSVRPLPPSAYFHAETYQREIDLLFKAGPGYVGHEAWVPEVNDWRTLPWEDHARVLIRRPEGVTLLSNICRHRQAIMLKGHGNSEHIVCPLHRWTYRNDGQLIGAPHFPETPCTRLHAQPLQNWRGLLFAGAKAVPSLLTDVPFLQEFDFSNYVLDSVQSHVCRYNWKTFIEVYLEDYHVEPFHPGLGQFVECSDLQWHMGEHWSVQSVGTRSGLRRPGTAVYEQWHEAVLRFGHGQVPRYGAIWFCLYPNIMVEWYPHVLVVSTLHPRGPQETLNVVEFYYPEEIAYFERDFITAEQKAYFETAVEDDEIAERMDEGRRALYQRGLDEFGPYQSPMEDGMEHFHTWYNSNTGH